MKITHNTEEKTKIDLSKRLIQFLKPTLGKMCKIFYKQNIKVATKYTYINQREAKHADILCKAKDNLEGDQGQYNTE